MWSFMNSIDFDYQNFTKPLKRNKKNIKFKILNLWIWERLNRFQSRVIIVKLKHEKKSFVKLKYLKYIYIY